jgi:hypothetical protein
MSDDKNKPGLRDLFREILPREAEQINSINWDDLDPIIAERIKKIESEYLK